MNHYATLNLPSPSGQQHGDHSTASTLESIKQAYRAALLTHHPDKKSVASVPKTPSPQKPSIDAIKLAYRVLSDPKMRAEYDRELIIRQETVVDSARNDTLTDERRGFRTGEELLDLDDMTYDEVAGIWFRACRCGEQKGYTLTEAQLEEEESKGGREVVVGCSGCSLWLRVAFAVDDGLESAQGGS
jgi:diphthamide biosynthesis protein 4